MLLKILDKHKTPVAGFNKFKDLCIDHKLEFSDQTLSFKCLYSDIEGIVVPEGYIETKEDRFVIKEVNKSLKGTAEVVAQLDLEDLEGKVFLSFSSMEQSIDKALQLAFVGTGWTVGLCEVKKKRTIRMSKASSLAVLTQALKTYRCEIKINSLKKIIDIYEEIGSDKGAYFIDTLNLKELIAKESSYDFYTEIEAYGKDGMSFADINNGSPILTNHSYSNKKKRYIWTDDRYTVKESLKEDAEAKLKDMATPYKAYEGNAVDLAAMSDDYEILDFKLGDTVTLVSKTIGVREKQRIVEIKEYPEEPERTTFTYANKILTFEELTQKYESAASTVDNITSDNGTVKGSTVDSIKSEQVVDLENSITNNATIVNLKTTSLEVSGEVQAVKARIGEINANVANIEQANIDRINAAEAKIADLKATDLTAINADIKKLDSGFGDIRNLISGNTVTGDLRTIHLTADNAVIDSALIKYVVSQNITAADLMSGNISTNKFTIGSDDGSFKIENGTQTIKDSKGNTRIQIGKDASGNFSFIVYDATGKGQLFNENGITASAISDGLVVDKMVADNAAINAKKLDIQSLYREMNNSTEVLKSSRIYFDDKGQTLNQIYSQLTNSMDAVKTAAKEATDQAKKSLDAVDGISTVDTVGAFLSNDAHVVHTIADGTGGNYSDCLTQIYVYKGDVDVTGNTDVVAHPGPGVVGAWDPATHIYHVTDLHEMNGYVDFDIVVESLKEYLALPGGNRLKFPNGSTLLLKGKGTHVYKRFSVSKSPDGQVGVSYRLQTDPSIIKRSLEGNLVPGFIKLSAIKSVGNETNPFAGKFKIEHSTNGVDYSIGYSSDTPEVNKTYYVPKTAKYIRCSLLDDSGSVLDIETVTIIADSDGMQGAISNAIETVQTLNEKVTNIQSGYDGFNASLSELETKIHGVSNGTIVYQVENREDGDTVVLNGVIYKDGVEVTKDYPPGWFKWFKKTEAGKIYLSDGYSVTVDMNDFKYGGVVVGEFTTFIGSGLLFPDHKYLIFPDSKRLTVYVDA